MYTLERHEEIMNLLENKKSISEIAEMLGYNLYSFSKAFKRAYGTSPKSTQKASGLN